VFVALPINVMEQETTVPPGKPAQIFRASRPDPAGIEAMSKLIVAAKNPTIVAGDDVARSGATKTLEKLVERIGASVWFEGLRGRNAFPTDNPAYRGTLAFDAPGVAKQFAENDLVLLVGGPFFEEVWYGPGSPFANDCKVLQIEASAPRMAYNFAVDAGVIADVEASLEALWQTTTGINGAAARARQDAFRQRRQADDAAQKARVEKAWSRTPISMARVMAELQMASPANVVVVDETITANLDLFKTFTFKGPGDYYSGRGGGIGQGVAGALGVAVADQSRPILCVSGDGSSMYSIQALWTAAHHELPIVFVILANREYRVLKHNIDAYRARFDVKSNKPYMHMDLSGPVMGFVDLAKGMGVAGTHVAKAEDIGPAVAAAFRSGKPHLIEIEIEGKR
jgi:benzoylformate decarboxylase